MAQKQLSYGFSETLLQVDETTFIRVYNRQEPEIEIISDGRKLTLSYQQWEKIRNLTHNIQLAFTLLNDNKTPHDSFEDIVNSLGL